MDISKSRPTNKGFVSLIGLLITIAIISMLLYLAAKSATKGTSSQSGHDSRPKTVLDKARNAVDSINKRRSEGELE